LKCNLISYNKFIKLQPFTIVLLTLRQLRLPLSEQLSTRCRCGRQ